MQSFLRVSMISKKVIFMVFIVKSRRQEINDGKKHELEQRIFTMEQKINANTLLMKKQIDTLTAITYLLYKKNKKTKSKPRKNRLGSAEIQKRIFNIIEQGPIDTVNLAYELRKKNICTKNTMYKQLKQLTELGSIVKTRNKRKVIYTTKKTMPENYGDVLI
jgi:hypothetical protein